MEGASPKGKNLREPFSRYKNKGLNCLTTASGFLMFSRSSQIVLCFKLLDGHGNTQVCTLHKHVHIPGSIHVHMSRKWMSDQENEIFKNR